jgi:hypothetical protein
MYDHFHLIVSIGALWPTGGEITHYVPQSLKLRPKLPQLPCDLLAAAEGYVAQTESGHFDSGAAEECFA